MTHLPQQWQTERLLIANAEAGEAETLRALFNACAALMPGWDPTFHRVDREEMARLVQQSLDANPAVQRLFCLQTVCRRDDGSLAGYFHLTHGMPRPKLIYMSMFVIHPAAQDEGLGRELVAGLLAQFKQLGYDAVWLDVYLKNWPALRFWINNGFTTIIDYDGDPIYDEASHASIVLEHRLR